VSDGTRPGSSQALLPDALRQEIEDAITHSATAWDAFVAANLEIGDGDVHLPLAIKYVPVDRARAYVAPPHPNAFYAGANHYTWGIGVYVVGIKEPVSTAIYGRAGVVARFDPAGWRAFDARVAANRSLYLRWLQAQIVYPDALLTVHTDYFLHGLRNLFREQFQLDVVLFHPDESDRHNWYTKPTDTWLAVSEWTPTYRLRTGPSSRFLDPRLTVLIEEEFAVDKPALTRSPHLTLSSFVPAHWITRHMVGHAYRAGAVLRVPT
jgi:hypothetical protein